jgi:hypothetical protein
MADGILSARSAVMDGGGAETGLAGSACRANREPVPSAIASVRGQISSSRRSGGLVSHGDRPRPELIAIAESVREPPQA